MKEWFSVKELAGLPDLPSTVQKIRTRAVRENWESRKKEKGKGFEFHINSLPAAAKTALVRAQEKQNQTTQQTMLPPMSSHALWKYYGAAKDVVKEEARKRLLLIDQVLSLEVVSTRQEAIALIAQENNVSASTIRRWFRMIKPYEKSDWLAALLPHYSGSNRHSDINDKAWDFFKTDYLRLEKPTVADCYRRLETTARVNGWDVPSKRTLQRWIKTKIDHHIYVMKREGMIALMQLFPALQRSVRDLTALEAINGDGYQHNVFVKFDNGEVGRPKTWFWQDVYSRKILAYRTARTENTDVIRFSFGDVVEVYGIPKHVTIDNTRAAANKWMTGGMRNRYRFKIRDDEPIGIFKLLGVKVHWTSVNQAGTQAKGHGQAKPIERTFGVGGLGDWVDKHPDFVGAYTGPNVEAKPENYSEKAVDIERFLKTLDEQIISWNAREGRRTEMSNGVKSFDQVFTESYVVSPIRKATREQRNLWLLAAEQIRVQKDGTFTLANGAKTGKGKDGRNRYYAEELSHYGYEGKTIVIRFEPYNLHDEVHAYTNEGEYIAACRCIDAAGFYDTVIAREHNRARRQAIKAVKELEQAQNRMDMLEYQQTMHRPQLPDPEPAKVIEPVRVDLDMPPKSFEEEQLDAALVELQKEFNASLNADSTGITPNDLNNMQDAELYELWIKLDKNNELITQDFLRNFYTSFPETYVYEVQKHMAEMAVEFEQQTTSVAQ